MRHNALPAADASINKSDTAEAQPVTGKKKPPTAVFSAAHQLLGAAAVFVSTGVDFDFVTDLNESWHLQFKTSFDFGDFHHFT